MREPPVLTRLAPFVPLTLDQLFALNLPEITYLVDELLPQGAACLFSAREKAGKGLLTIDLCVSIALGVPFLDRPVQEGPAIYGAAEENLRDVRARVEARLGARRDAPLYVLPLDGSTGDRLKLDDLEAMQRLLGMIQQIQPALVVLDTLRELHDRREDLSDEMGPLVRPLRQIAHETNTTIVLNHHHRKSGGPRGSTAILAACDLGWTFSRTDEEQESGPIRATLRVEGRHGPRTVMNIRLGEGLRWEPNHLIAPSPEPGVRGRILAYLEMVTTWQSAGEIAQGTGIKLKTTQNVLAELVQESPHPLAVRGAGTKNAPRQYRTRSPRLEGFAPAGADGMIPPDRIAVEDAVGGNQCRASAGEAGNDRWTT